MQNIEFYQTKKSSRRYKSSDIFQYNKKGRFPFLQRMLFGILKKLKCYALYDEILIEKVSFNPKKIIESLYQQREEIFKTGADTQGILYIGSDELDQLGHEVYADTPISFLAPYHSSTRGYEEVLGMKIVVVPWLKGAFVAPQSKRVD